MQFSINPTLWSKVFAVPTEITDNHIRRCTGFGVKCLLMILRDPAGLCDAKAIAERLGQPVSEVFDALSYWVESGVLLSNDAAPAPSRLLPAAPPPVAAAPTGQTPVASPAATPAASPVPTQRPHFPREEAVAIVDSDQTLHGLLQELQSMMGKLFTSADLDALIALYSFYALTPHYIVTLISYCISIGRVSMGYAEKVAASWIAEGIDDDGVDSHIDLLLQRRGNEGRIRTAFGIRDRNLTAREREYIDTWFDSYQFDLPMIEYAYEITVERTGKLAFGYLNKILSSWHQNKIRTLEEAKQESKSTSSAKSQPATAKADSGLDRKILEQFMKD